MDKPQLIALFQWMTLINIGVLLFSAVLLIALRRVVGQTHARLFGIKPEQAAFAAYMWLGAYKILIIVFCVVPYVALRLI